MHAKEDSKLGKYVLNIRITQRVNNEIGAETKLVYTSGKRYILFTNFALVWNFLKAYSYQK